MGSVDRTFARTGDRELKRLKREQIKKILEKRKYQNSGGCDVLASEEEITSMAAEDESNLDPRCSPKSTKRGSAPIVKSELSAALDRANVSNRTETFYSGRNCTESWARNLWLKCQL